MIGLKSNIRKPFLKCKRFCGMTYVYRYNHIIFETFLEMHKILWYDIYYQSTTLFEKLTDAHENMER